MRYFYYKPIKPLLIILFASIAFIILQPILVAYADETTSRPIRGGAVICNTKKTPQGEETKDDGWWWCYDGKSSHRVSYDGLKCDSGYKADSRKVQGSIPKEEPYSQGRCVKLSKEDQIKNARKKASIDAVTNQVNMPNLEEVLKPKITNSTWYKGLSDSEKLEAGCATISGSISCDQNAQKKLAKKLIGICIVEAEEAVSSRKYGDTGSSAKNQYFTDCVSSRSGITKDQVTQNMTAIAWDNIKKEMDAAAQKAENTLTKPEETKSKEADGEEVKNSCGIDGIGWLICPLMRFAGSLGDASYSAISQFLSIDKGVFDNQSNGGLKQAWNFFRDIANAAFALLFLWVIFSQISNVGISNYGIKRILPRLIIGALLVNLSFYLCQLAVDLSNILGSSLKGVLEGAASGIDTQSAANGSFSTFFAVGLALAGVALFMFLTVSIPTILSLLLVLVVVLVILIVRQSAVILLIAISPLAFAAWLLPNTENLFKKWMSMFRGLLVVFPVISLLYGAGKLAGAVLAASATDDPNNPKETMQFAALAASILPLGATPFVIKSSLNSLGSIGAKIGGLSGAATGVLKNSAKNTSRMNAAKSRINDVKNAWKSRSARKTAERRSGNTRFGRKADELRKSGNRFVRGAGVVINPIRALDNSRFGRKIGLDEGERAAQEAYDKNAMEKAERALTYQYGGDAAAALKDENADKYIRIAAVNQLKSQGTYGADKIAEYLGAGGKVDSVSMAKSLTDMKGSHAGVAKAGAEALKALQKEDGTSEINFSSDQFNDFTALGVGELSNKDIAGQSAQAIKNSNITADKATEILSNDILYSSANNAVISALKEKGGKRIIPQTPQDNQNDQQGNNSQQSQQNSQGNNSQQSSQNNQQSNSSSGGE